MQNAEKVILMIVSSLLTVGCGDKLDPLTGEETTTASASDGNSSSNSNSNSTATAPATTASNSNGLCNTGATTITYSVHAKTVFTASCSQSGCHSTQSKSNGIATDTYAGAKAAFTSNDAQDAVDTKRMPLSGSLTSDQICILDNWVNDGFLQ